jgi:hypothetical protein
VRVVCGGTHTDIDEPALEVGEAQQALVLGEYHVGRLVRTDGPVLEPRARPEERKECHE